MSDYVATPRSKKHKQPIQNQRHLLTFIMMFTVGLLTSGLTLRVRRQALEARMRARNGPWDELLLTSGAAAWCYEGLERMALENWLVVDSSDQSAEETVEEIIDLTLKLGARTNPAIRCGGISYNSSSLGEDDARQLMACESARLGLPVAVPVRGGA